jgi:hypothetical protein
VVQITSKTSTTSNSSNQSSSNANTLGSWIVNDKHGHIVTTGHVVGAYVTFPDVCKGSVCYILQMAIDILQRF